MPEFKIVHPDASKIESAGIADLLCEAFREKKLALQVSEPVARELIGTGVNIHNCLVAVVGGVLAGAIGFSTATQRFLYVPYSSIRKKYGVPRSVILYLAANIFGHHRPRPDEFAIEALAVKDTLRGNGIGSALLSATETRARQDGFSRLTLEVVDTNITAQRLYRKRGFLPVKTRHFGILTRSAGFESSTLMAKTL